jgi:hypothetical protein
VKKLIALLLLGAFLFTGVVGCGGAASTGKGTDKGKDAEKKDKDKS